MRSQKKKVFCVRCITKKNHIKIFFKNLNVNLSICLPDLLLCLFCDDDQLFSSHDIAKTLTVSFVLYGTKIFIILLCN